MSNKLAQHLYDYIHFQLKDVDYYPDCNMPELNFTDFEKIITINNSFNYNKILYAFDILLRSKDSWHSEVPMKHLVEIYKKSIKAKYTVIDYPEVWI